MSWVADLPEQEVLSSQESGGGDYQYCPPPKRFRSALADDSDIDLSQDYGRTCAGGSDWETWDSDTVACKLTEAGFPDVAEKFKEQAIVGCVLPSITDGHLAKMGIETIGRQLLIQKFIQDTTQTVPLKNVNNSKKVFNDPIHGHIELHPLCVKIIDTPQFQRLRFIRQLGTCFFVYYGATHSRFEHSIGVCHLAGQLVRALQRRQPYLEITDRDVLCVEIAGLCHDLGHGPFSHMFDGKFIPLMCPNTKWRHEDASRQMLEYLLEDNALVPVFAEYGLTDQDITFIKEQVTGPRKELQAQHWPFEGRNSKKRFLYEIVANKRNGIDVDKWDYFARDCHMLGISNNFDHTRFMQFARVLKVEGELQICSRDKEVGNLYDMFHTRNTLHRRAYQHKVANVIDTMVVEALMKANDYIKLEGRDGKLLKMTEAIYDMRAYCQLTDEVFFQILHSCDPKLAPSRKILEAIMCRRLYKCVGQTQLKASQVVAKDQIPHIKEEILAAMDSDERECSPLQDEDVIVHLVFLDYGMKDKNPIDSVRFYMKESPDVPIRVRKDQVSQMLPETFSEQHILIHCKINEPRCLAMVGRAFCDWCKQKDFPQPKGGNVNALELTPVSKGTPNSDVCTPTSSTQNGLSRNRTPDSAGKFRSKLSF